MKIRSILTGLAMTALLASCSDKNEPDPTPVPEPSGNQSILVKITTNPDSRTTEDGTTEEQAITKLRFYFFNDVNLSYPIMTYSPANLGPNGAHFIDVTPDASFSTTKTVKVNLYSDTKKEIAATIPFHMFVVANPDAANLDESYANIDALKTAVGEYSISNPTAGSFVMTNSSYVNEDNKEVCVITVTGDNIIDDQVSGSGQTPVEVKLERVNAKVKATLNWDASQETAANVTVTGIDGTYTAVQLLEKDSDDNTKAIMADGKKLYAVFTGWGLINETTQSHLFKKINSEWNLGWAWNDHNAKRSFWAINPATAGNNTTSISWDNLSAAFNANGIYTQENAANNTDGSKTDAATTAVFGAILATLGENNVATPVSLVRLSDGKMMLREDAINTLYGNLENKIWVRQTLGQEIFTTDITPYLTFKDENGQQYLQIDSEKVGEHIFYKENKATDEDMAAESNKYSVEELNTLLKEKIGAVSVYTDGRTYYTYPIVHSTHDAALTTENVNNGRYGIVRNHVYDIQLNTVYGPGNAVFTPETFTPVPVEHNFSLNASIEVLPWNVVNSGNTSLEWGNNHAN